MEHIDEGRLETDPEYRFGYLAGFMGFGEEDIAAVHGAAEHLGPVVPQLVDAVYDKLFSYDATKRHFVPRQSGYEGPLPDSVDALEQDHELIEFRKQHLGRYLVTLVTKPYNGKMVAYLDMVGKMHTPKAGSKALDVPLVQMNALMGFVADALLATIASLGLDHDVEVRTQRAFSKLLWIQNDLINRHYAANPEVASAWERCRGASEGVRRVKRTGRNLLLRVSRFQQVIKGKAVRLAARIPKTHENSSPIPAKNMS